MSGISLLEINLMDWVFIIAGFVVLALFIAFMAERKRKGSNVTNHAIKTTKNNDDGIGWVDAGVIDSIIN